VATKQFIDIYNFHQRVRKESEISGILDLANTQLFLLSWSWHFGKEAVSSC